MSIGLSLHLMIETILVAGGLVLLVPVSVLLVQAVCSMLPGRPRVAPVSTALPMVVLVPAHNEASGLIATLRSVVPQLRPGDRCLVVADNCTDDTARVAVGEGAEVVERFDDEKRGKGYALAFGLQALDAAPPEVIVVVDADCIVGPGALGLIGRLCTATQRPVQALYLMKSPKNAKRMTAIAEFAWRVKNWGRPLGWQRLGLPCQLMGSGMAFPWKALRSIDLASGHLVEDIKMGTDLARLGAPAIFCPEALVTSEFPSNESGAKSQRTRWEHGHLGMIVSDVPRLLVDAIRRPNLALLSLAIDLLVPPLALLVMLVVGLFAVSAVAALTGLGTGPMILVAIVFALMITAVGLFWLKFGTDIVSIGTLALAAVYALRKIPVYFKFIAGRQMEWVKSRRDSE